MLARRAFLYRCCPYHLCQHGPHGADAVLRFRSPGTVLWALLPLRLLGKIRSIVGIGMRTPTVAAVHLPPLPGPAFILTVQHTQHITLLRRSTATFQPSTPLRVTARLRYEYWSWSTFAATVLMPKLSMLLPSLPPSKYAVCHFPKEINVHILDLHPAGSQSRVRARRCFGGEALSLWSSQKESRRSLSMYIKRHVVG